MSQKNRLLSRFRHVLDPSCELCQVKKMLYLSLQCVCLVYPALPAPGGGELVPLPPNPHPLLLLGAQLLHLDRRPPSPAPPPAQLLLLVRLDLGEDGHFGHGSHDGGVATAPDGFVVQVHKGFAGGLDVLHNENVLVERDGDVDLLKEHVALHGRVVTVQVGFSNHSDSRGWHSSVVLMMMTH